MVKPQKCDLTMLFSHTITEPIVDSVGGVFGRSDNQRHSFSNISLLAIRGPFYIATMLCNCSSAGIQMDAFHGSLSDATPQQRLGFLSPSLFLPESPNDGHNMGSPPHNFGWIP